MPPLTKTLQSGRYFRRLKIRKHAENKVLVHHNALRSYTELGLTNHSAFLNVAVLSLKKKNSPA